MTKKPPIKQPLQVEVSFVDTLTPEEMAERVNDLNNALIDGAIEYLGSQTAIKQRNVAYRANSVKIQA